MMNNRADIPWYRWRFSLGGLCLLIFFGFTAWGAATDENHQAWSRVFGGLLFLSVAVWVAWQEWKYRKGIRFLLTKKTDGKEA